MAFAAGLTLGGFAQVVVGSVLGAIVVRKIAGPAPVVCLPPPGGETKALPASTVKGVEGVDGTEHVDGCGCAACVVGVDEVEDDVEGEAVACVEGDEAAGLIRAPYSDPRPNRRDHEGRLYSNVGGDDVGRHHHHPGQGQYGQGQYGQGQYGQGQYGQGQYGQQSPQGQWGQGWNQPWQQGQLQPGQPGYVAPGTTPATPGATLPRASRLVESAAVYSAATDQGNSRNLGTLPRDTRVQIQQEGVDGPGGGSPKKWSRITGPKSGWVWSDTLAGASDGTVGEVVDGVSGWGVPYRLSTSKWSLPVRVVDKGGVPAKFVFSAWALPAHVVSEGGIPVRDVGSPAPASTTPATTLAPSAASAPASPAKPAKVSGWADSPAAVAGWGDQLFKGLEIGGSGVATAFLGPEAGAAVRTLGDASKAAIDKETGHDPNAGHYPLSAMPGGGGATPPIAAPAPPTPQAPVSAPAGGAGDPATGATRGALRVAPGATVYCGPQIKWVPIRQRTAALATPTPTPTPTNV